MEISGTRLGKPVPFANRAPSWILRRALPGTGGPAQKFATSPFVNYRSPRSSASRIIQNGSHEKRPPGFLAEVKLQCLQVGYFSPGVGVYFLSILASLTRVNYTKLDVKPSHLNLLWMEDWKLTTGTVDQKGLESSLSWYVTHAIRSLWLR